MKNPIPIVREFYDETVQEVKKCTWPSRAELIETTGIVLIGLIILSSFIFVADKIMQWVIRTLI